MPENQEDQIEVQDFTLELTKESQRTLNDAKVTEQINYIVERILASNRSRRWLCERKVETPTYASLSKTTTYKVILTLTPSTYIKDKTELEFQSVQEIAQKAAETQRWTLTKYGSEVLVAGKESSDLIVPDDWYNAWFSHIYEREHQIRVIMSAIQAGIHSGFENRFHCVLYGPPACGKTEITRSFKDMFGDEAVLEYDATSTTQAGAIRDLANRPVVPKLLIVEEIEKTDENSLRWLLSVLDHRAEIRKTNYREQVQREIKLMCLATVNDFDLFKKLMYGALASRFSHKIYCPRPNEEILTKILTREVTRVEGNLDWIKPAIKYAMKNNLNDPRQVTAICLSGGDDLLSGAYQEMLWSCRGPDMDDDVADI